MDSQRGNRLFIARSLTWAPTDRTRLTVLTQFPLHSGRIARTISNDGK